MSLLHKQRWHRPQQIIGRKIPRNIQRNLLGLLALLFLCVACSPFYVMKAGWKEAGILLRSEKISAVIAEPKTEDSLRHKLQTVLLARQFATEIGLKPEGSFSKYSTVHGDVLVWVLSASPPTSLEPVTWWFPIVGSVPYKGFFEKADGLKAEQKLKATGFDTFLRPSAAFSTLGWFDDPLLSTMIKFEDVSLVNTVIHEILHNTIWIKNNAAFNETLANFVGSVGSKDFFVARDGNSSAAAQKAGDEWHDELMFSSLLERLFTDLERLYKEYKPPQGAEADSEATQLLQKRQMIWDAAMLTWKSQASELKTERYKNLGPAVNNAAIIAHRIYLTKPEAFVELYHLCGDSLSKFIEVMKDIAAAANKDGKDPYAVLRQYTLTHQSAGS